MNNNDEYLDPLQFYALKGQYQILKYMINSPNCPEVNVFSSTPLHYAAENGNLNTFLLLTEKGYDIHISGKAYSKSLLFDPFN